MVSKAHERRDVDRKRCRSNALEQDPKKTRALSSGEAEYYATVTGCAEGLEMQSVAEDLGWKAEMWLWTDRFAAKAIGNRWGLGKFRHVELKWLWVQDVVKEGRVKLKTVKGNENVADHLRKPRLKNCSVRSEPSSWSSSTGAGARPPVEEEVFIYGV